MYLIETKAVHFSAFPAHFYLTLVLSTILIRSSTWIRWRPGICELQARVCLHQLPRSQNCKKLSGCLVGTRLHVICRLVLCPAKYNLRKICLVTLRAFLGFLHTSAGFKRGRRWLYMDIQICSIDILSLTIDFKMSSVWSLCMEFYGAWQLLAMHHRTLYLRTKLWTFL